MIFIFTISDKINEKVLHIPIKIYDQVFLKVHLWQDEKSVVGEESGKEELLGRNLGILFNRMK